MQNLSIHGVTGIEILPTVNSPLTPGVQWQTINIYHKEGKFCLDLFPAEGSNAEIKEETPKNPIPKLITFGPNHSCIVAGEKTYYYSYATCVAYSDSSLSVRVRSCSKTTGRHMLHMGVAPFTVLEDAEFSKLIS